MDCFVASIRGVPSSASLALDCEGVRHERITLTGKLGYWKLLTRLWGSGQGFILLEHDVVPWPGAITQLAGCPGLWCVHEYPYGDPPELIWALGACKVSAEVTKEHPGPQRVRWDGLDHFARGVLLDALGPPHVHQPPFAHTRDRGA